MLKETMERYGAMVEAALEGFLPAETCRQSRIFEACRYSLMAGGKRIRPMLLLEFYRLCGGKPEEALPFACGLEMIHTYSLIHDDLPCMDDDDFRRGRPTNHKVYGEAMAVLAGDALLTDAFAVAATTKVEGKAMADLIGILSVCAGSLGMVGGQVQDLALEGKTATLEELQEMVGLKTGALLRAACEGGALLAGAGEERLQAARNYADCIGLAFQIQVDILDLTGDQAVLGKAIGSDANNQKTTFVSVYGLETCRSMVRNLTQQALAAAEVFADGEFLKELALYLAQRNH